MAKKAATPQDTSARWNEESRKAQKTWKKAREAKAGNDFSNPEIADGNYVARVLKAKADFTKGDKKKGYASIPYVSLTLVVVEGEYVGTKLNRMDRLGGNDEDQAVANQERFAKTMDGIGYNCEELELKEVPDLVKSINDDKPFVHITVANNTGKDGKEYLNVYCNKVATQDELDELGIGDDAGDDAEDDTAEEKAEPKKTSAKKAPANRGTARKR